MSAWQGSRGAADEPAGQAVRTAGGQVASHGPLAEPGILLGMVSPAAEEEPAAGARRTFVAASTRLGRSFDSLDGTARWPFAWLVAAIVWLVLDAAATLGRSGPLGVERALPGILAAAVCGFGLGTVLPVARRLAAAAEVVCVLALLAAAAAGWCRQDVLRIGLQAGAAALLVARAFAASPTARGRALGGLVVTALVGVAAALLRPLVLGAGGPAAAQALSVAFLLLVLLPAAPRTHRQPPLPRRALLAGAACLLLLWWAAPSAAAVDGATAARVLFALAVALSLAPLAGGPVAATIVLVALAAAGAHWAPSGPRPAAVAATTVLATSGPVAAVYQRATQTLQLMVDGEVVDRAGPDHRGAELASTLVQAFARPGDRVLVLGAGTGRLPDLLLRSGRHEVEVVAGRSEPAALRTALRGDGPVLPAVAASAGDPRQRRFVRPWRQALAAMPAASRQAIVVAELPHAAAALQATVEWQRELRRVAGDGVVLQAFAFDLMPAGRLRALLGAAAVAHPWNAVLAVGDDAWLLSAAAPPRWPAEAAWSRWPEDARWIAHAAHIGGGLDLRRAMHGTVAAAASRAAVGELDPPPADGARGRRDVLAVLHDLLHAEPIEAMVDPRSLLLRWLGHRINVQLARDEIAGLGDGDADRLRAQAIASRFLPVGAPSAWLQAALGLPAPDGEPLVDPSLAIRRAHAIDPTFGDALPPVLAGALPRPNAIGGELEDLATLPARERLAELCVGGAPLAVALRARFGSACARALVEVLAHRALSTDEGEALRELADPFVLEAAGRVLAARDALAELLPLWRRDLPMPVALAALPQSTDIAVQLRLATALGGRTDGASLRALAERLVSPVVELRRVAAQALRASVGDAIPYDPEWPRSALNEAADRLRSLHNRTP